MGQLLGTHGVPWYCLVMLPANKRSAPHNDSTFQDQNKLTLHYGHRINHQSLTLLGIRILELIGKHTNQKLLNLAKLQQSQLVCICRRICSFQQTFWFWVNRDGESLIIHNVSTKYDTPKLYIFGKIAETLIYISKSFKTRSRWLLQQL